MSRKFKIIGNPVMINKSKFKDKPKRKFRVIIQERKTNGRAVESMRSFMIYDFKGRATIDSVKRKLLKSIFGKEGRK